jgi:hypothetical protein
MPLSLKEFVRSLSGKLKSASTKSASTKSIRIEVEGSSCDQDGTSAKPSTVSANKSPVLGVDRRAGLEAAARMGSSRALAQLEKASEEQPKDVQRELVSAEAKRQAAQQAEAKRQAAIDEQRQRRANEAAFEHVQPLVCEWAAQRGEASAVKRYARRPELRLLVLNLDELKEAIQTQQWRQFSTSGLKEDEVRALTHHLSRSGTHSAVAAPFLRMLHERVATYEVPPPSEDEAVAAAPPPAPAEAGTTGATVPGAEVRILSTLDDELVVALLAGAIRLLRSSWLTLQPADYIVERRQQLEERERNGEEPTPLMSPEEGAALLRRACRCVGAMSYGWATAVHPDPRGVRYQMLRGALQADGRSHIEGVFWGTLHRWRLNPVPSHAGATNLSIRTSVACRLRLALPALPRWQAQ